MKVIFIYLPHPYLNQPDAQAPLGLMYLASVLENNNIDVDIKSYSSYTVETAIDNLPEADIYGITVTSLELLESNSFSKLIKDKYPKCKIFLGGPGTTTKEFVDFSIIDSICVGDGEITILQMIDDVRNDSLQSIYYGEALKNLDDLPLPARHLLDIQGGNVFVNNKNYREGGSTIILTSRGCPFNCSFCSAPSFTYNRNVRFRSAQSVYDEMKSVIENFGITQFRFSDDMFTANINHVNEICKKIKKLDVVWRISCRVKPFTEDMAKTLFDAGCVEASFGVESFDDNVLKMLNKKTSADDNAKALEICAKVGIKTRVLFMIRTPGQTEKTVDINIDYLKKVPYDIVACTSFVPIPGSDIWNNPDKYNIEIFNKNLDDYNFYFFGSSGENKLKPIFKIKDRSFEDFHNESIRFREWLKKEANVNRG